MELLALNYPVTTPRKAIVGWTSLVWNLRYQKPGEFKLTTSKIAETMADMPIDSMVAINEGTEVMMVHTHEITQDAKGQNQLIVSGEGFPGFMKNRIALDNYGYYNDYKNDNGTLVEDGVHSWRLENGAWNDADAAYDLIYHHLKIGMFNSALGTIRPEVLPNFDIVQTDTSNRRYYLRYIPRTDVLTAVESLLVSGRNGIKSVRAIGSATNTQFVLYKGVDRSKGQTTNPVVILWHDQGHLLTAKYLMSSKGYYNSFRIFPTKKAFHQNWVWSGETVTDPSRFGINYRDKLVDASEISSDDQNEVDSAINQRLATEIAQNVRTSIVECTVAENIPYVFGTHYNLGDILTIVGDFGIVKNAMVSEYVMTEDKNGLRSSPGLTIFQ